MRHETMREWLVQSLGEYGESLDGLESWRAINKRGRDKADSGVDAEFYSGFAGSYASSFYGWSEDWVYYLHEYDGSSEIRRVPRRPDVTEPERIECEWCAQSALAGSKLPDGWRESVDSKDGKVVARFYECPGCA